jgi:hypothetical protein
MLFQPLRQVLLITLRQEIHHSRLLSSALVLAYIVSRSAQSLCSISVLTLYAPSLCPALPSTFDERFARSG